MGGKGEKSSARSAWARGFPPPHLPILPRLFWPFPSLSYGLPHRLTWLEPSKILNCCFFDHVQHQQIVLSWKLHTEKQNLLRDLFRYAVITEESVPKVALSSLHTANLNWQTRVGKRKLVCVNGAKTVGQHVGKLLATNRTCLPTVFAPFTHTNLSLPTRVCQL